MIARRSFIASGLAGLAGLAVSAVNPSIAWAAANTAKRFVFIIQRGAADGLATVAPTGDPNYLSARGAPAEDALNGTKLDSFFTLHSGMKQAAALFAQKQASFVHAMSSGCRERSHFDAQNMLESGASRPYGSNQGWMNRLLSLLPDGEARALAFASAVLLALRGPYPAGSYEDSRMRGPNDDLMQRISMMYGEDAQLAQLWDDAQTTQNMAGKQTGPRRGGAAVGTMAAKLMNDQKGARVVMLESNGWDTHSGQRGRLRNQLQDIDALIDALRIGLGAQWGNTLVLVATEFGRTVAFNGTAGTDHGTGSAAMLFGGNLANGGIVQADWPGLAPSVLFEGRDLKPTMRFETVVSDALSHHFGLDPALALKTLFPDFV